MATIDSLLDLVRQEAYQKAGGGQPDTLDKINATFGNINNIITQRLEAKKRELETKKLGLESEKLKRETTPSFAVDLPRNQTDIDAETPIYEKRKADIDALRAKFLSQSPGRAGMGEEQFRDIGLGAPEAIKKTTQKMLTPDEFKTYAQAQAALRERPQSDFTPFLADSNIETLTGGKIPKGSMTNMAIVKQFSAGERAETIATAQANKQEAGQVRGAQIKEAGENRAKYKADLDLIQSVKDNIAAAKEEIKNVPAGIEGAAQSLIAKTGLAYPSASTYDRTRNALAVSLYRAMTGDTRLSDADAAARALPLLPSTNQNDPQRSKLWNFIDNAIARREQFLEQGIKEVPWANVVPQAEQTTQNSGSNSGVTKSGVSYKVIP